MRLKHGQLVGCVGRLDAILALDGEAGLDDYVADLVPRELERSLTAHVLIVVEKWADVQPKGPGLEDAVDHTDVLDDVFRRIHKEAGDDSVPLALEKSKKC